MCEALLEVNPNPLMVDGTIQRFEFVLELFWKTLKRLLAYEGIQTDSPRDTLQRAFQAGWLTDENLWLKMLKDRNETSHTYDEESAHEIFLRIKIYFPELDKTNQFLRHKFGDHI